MKSAGPVSRADAKVVLRRLGFAFLILLVAGYVLGVGGGWLFLRYGRKVEEVRLLDVALVRLTAIRRAQAAQNFQQARAAWDAKDYQQAYVHFSSALARDPANLEGRLAAARFFASLGATNLELSVLEEGLARDPANARLRSALFDRLVATGRHRRILELLHGPQAAAFTGPAAATLRPVELQATFATAGAAAAKLLIDQHPELRTAPAAGLTVARVLWEAGDHAGAIRQLADRVQANPADFAGFRLLADCQREDGAEQAAIDTALDAVRRFPTEPSARVLLLDVGAARLRGTPDWWREVGAYLRDFRAEPQPVLLLAEQAGRRGWLELAASLYELGARRGHDLAFLGLCYGDALGQVGRVPEARAILNEVEQQTAGRSAPFQVQLQQRQIAAAAAASDREAVREHARRFAGLIRDDADALEYFRRHYQSVGLPEAVAELSERKPRTTAATPGRAGR